MSSFSNICTLATFGIPSLATQPWSSPQLQSECVYNQPPSWRLMTGFIGGPGGTQMWATNEGRIHSISWGISKALPEYAIDYDAVANLTFESDMQSGNAVFGTDTVHLCTPFVLQDGDHILGYRVIYGDFVHGLYLHTRNGLSYSCLANMSNTPFIRDSGDVYYNNSYLSGFQVRAGGVIDAISFVFTDCAYSTYPPTSDPTIEPTMPTITTINPTIEPTINPTIQPTIEPTIIYLIYIATPSPSKSPTPLLTLLWIIISVLSIIVCFGVYCLFRFCLNKDQKRPVYEVDKALVLIIGISEFNSQIIDNLPGVELNVDSLIALWTDSFNYDVYVCHSGMRYDIIAFVNYHTTVTLRNDSSYKAVLVHILSHGSSDKEAFITSDCKSIGTHLIKRKLAEAATHSNKGLVKIMFYDACRGEQNYSDPNRTVYGQHRCCFCCFCCCIGNDNYEEKENDSGIPVRGSCGIPDAVSRSDPNLNSVTIYGTTENRTVADKGEFSLCICDVFGRSVRSRNGCFNLQKPKDFNLLISEVGRKLLRDTNHAQICSSNGMATIHKKIIFKKFVQ